MTGRDLYIARFKGVTGRYLVSEESGGYGGQKIATARQAKYGNPQDPTTGLYLNEMYRTFGRWEVESLKRVEPPRRGQ